ncbi:MAG: DUF5615 family PIN-like protein [Nitriliruptoraceae bacterium]
MKLLLDEMYPPRTAVHLRDVHEIDAVHVRELGLDGSRDDVVAEAAIGSRRVVVTENAQDFASFAGLTVLVVRKRRLPNRGAQASALAAIIAQWSREVPDPTEGLHWPNPSRYGDRYPPRAGEEGFESGNTASADPGIYTHRSFDLGINVDVTCVGEVLEALERA